MTTERAKFLATIKNRAIVLLLPLPVTMGKFETSRITQLNVKEEKIRETKKNFFHEEKRINFRR